MRRAHDAFCNMLITHVNIHEDTGSRGVSKLSGDAEGRRRGWLYVRA